MDRWRNFNLMNIILASLRAVGREPDQWDVPMRSIIIIAIVAAFATCVGHANAGGG